MIFKIILLFIVTTISNVYPAERHTYSASRLKETSPHEVADFNVIYEHPILPQAERLFEVLQSVKDKQSLPRTSTSRAKEVTQKLTLKLSEPFDKLAVFKSGTAFTLEIKTARSAIEQIAYVLELSVLLQGTNKLPDLYTYLKDLPTNFKNVPLTLIHKSPHEIVAYYIEQCYRPLVQSSATSWMNRTPQLYLKDSVTASLQKNNDQLTLQVVEILHKLTLVWNYYAELFFDNEYDTSVKMAYPKEQLSIKNWAEITYNLAKDIYANTQQGKKALQEEADERAQQQEQLKQEEAHQLHLRTEQEKQRKQQQHQEAERRKKEELNAKEAARVKLQKELDEFNAYKEKVMKQLETSQAEMRREHIDAARDLMKSSIKKTKSTSLQEQETDLKLMEAIITLSNPDMMLINDELDTALQACSNITSDNIAQTDATVLASLVEAYEWLQEPRDMAREKKSFSDDESQQESYDDSYLHLKYKFNQQRLFKQIEYILKKAVFTWNTYVFVRFAGKLDTEVTLKFSAANKPKKSIIDWINFTSKAGFSYAGQFEKIKKQGPTKSMREKFNDLYKWGTNKLRRPTLTAEQTQALLDEVAADALLIEADEKAGREKIRRVMQINEDRIQNPDTTPTAVTPDTKPATPTTTKAVITKPTYTDFDPEFAEELKGRFTRTAK